MFAKLAGSKVITIIGAVLAVLGTLCAADQIHLLNRVLGEGTADTVCGLVATAGLILATLGQGLASRRPGPVDAGLVPSRTVEPSERREK